MITWKKGINSAQLNPVFRADIEKLLGESPYSWLVTFGHRTLEEQAELYKKYQAGGPKAAPPGKSAHNFGLAIDVALDGDPAKPGMQPSWNTKLAGWAWLWASCATHPRLTSGVKFADPDHIEAYKWKTKK